MSDPEIRENRSRSRKRNYVAKALHDQGDYKGAFSLKVINPKKGEYKREKFRLEDFEDD